MTPPPGPVANRAFRRLFGAQVTSVGLLAEHTVPAERGRAYAAHFALTHLFWLGTYPGVGYLSQAVGVPTTVGVFGGAADGAGCWDGRAAPITPGLNFRNDG